MTTPHRRTLAASITLVAAALAAGPARADAPACGAGGAPSVFAHVTGFKNGVGGVRVQAYGPDPATFLQKHQYARRVETRLAGGRVLDVCLTLPVAGRYAIAVRHDANNNGKSDWSDGAGFSRNPALSILHLRPAFDQVAVPVRAGAVSRVSIVMNYRRGLSIGPVAPPPGG